MTHNVFDFVKSVSFTKKDISDVPDFEDNYIPFVVNKAFSLHLDTLFYANEMNLNSHLSKHLQYSYYLNSLRPKKRFAPWAKRDVSEDELIKEIATYYNCGWKKAKEIKDVLKDEDLEQIKRRLDKGGVNE